MIIKLTAINDTKLGKNPAKEVVGNKIQDGVSWKKAFFANQKELRDQLEDFEVGDIVNVVLEQKGDYWNIKEFKEASDDDIEKATSGGKKFGGGSGKDTGYKRSDGGSRGDDTNRASAVYLSRELINMKGGLDKYTLGELAVLCVNLSNDFIFPYIKDGTVPVQETAKKNRKSSADPLAPPALED
jgi:hypothetical protein